jgi:hypothetical protein
MRTIALLEIGNDGHREAYMRYFISALLDLDCKVVCMIPDVTSTKKWVEENHPQKKEHVIYHSISFFRDKFPAAGRLRERFNILYNWYYIRKTLIAIEKKYELEIDFVFFNFLDAYLINYTPTSLLDTILGKKWSGIYFFPAFLRLNSSLLFEKTKIGSRDYSMSAKNCIAIGIHDEGILKDFGKRLGNKKVMLFPEIADLSEPDRMDPFRQQILQAAKGRIVVGNIGLEKHKGNYEMMSLAKRADPGKYFFVFTGRDDGTLFDFLTADQANELKTFIKDLPENCIWHPALFTEGSQFNAIISAFDIVYMIYTHFYGASNRLTKAAYFQKLILADDKYCIGDAVKLYDLGEVVPDTESGTLVAALERLYNRIEEKDFPIQKWNDFLVANSYENLKLRFKELLDLL